MFDRFEHLEDSFAATAWIVGERYKAIYRDIFFLDREKTYIAILIHPTNLFLGWIILQVQVEESTFTVHSDGTNNKLLHLDATRLSFPPNMNVLKQLILQ